jgi:toxin-antitoxin system PIN domain toxin
MTWLFDGNVLTALVLEGHVHHTRVKRWMAAQSGLDEAFATCVITQGTMLRLHMMYATDKSAAAAWQTLAALEAHPHHIFWDDGFGYRQVAYRLLSGPKQVTDAWLAQLARRRGAKLLTLDEALVALHGDVAVLLPESMDGCG